MKTLKTLTKEEFYQKLDPSKGMSPDDIIGGNIIKQSIMGLADRDIHTGVIKDPEYIIDEDMLCTIYDEGNHCISKGSIFYEAGLCIFTWSNHGHI